MILDLQYEHTDFNGDVIEVESYMVGTEDLVPGGRRLLEVDNKLIVPMGTYLRVLVTGAYVIHSFAVPALGVRGRRISKSVVELHSRHRCIKLEANALYLLCRQEKARGT